MDKHDAKEGKPQELSTQQAIRQCMDVFNEMVEKHLIHQAVAVSPDEDTVLMMTEVLMHMAGTLVHELRPEVDVENVKMELTLCMTTIIRYGSTNNVPDFEDGWL